MRSRGTSGDTGVTRRRDCHVRRDVIKAIVVMRVGDGEVHVVCVWRGINERWSRFLFENKLTGTIPSELGKLTNLRELYVLFTPPSFHVAHSRALPFLSPARSALSMFYLFSTGFFVPLIVLVLDFLSCA